MTTFTPRPLSATDGYLFTKEPLGTPFNARLTEAEVNEAKEVVAKQVYGGHIDRRLIVLPESGRLPLVGGGRRITYRIRPVSGS